MMKRNILLAALGLLMIGAGAAQADPPVTITQYIKGPFFLCANMNLLLKQDGNSYHLTALYNVPMPGYTYEFSPISVQNGRARGALKLIPPAQPIKQFLTPPLTLDYTFTSEEDIRELIIDVEKTFNWGDLRLVCTKSGH